jgi:outer membrane protein, multidrug efflux system
VRGARRGPVRALEAALDASWEIDIFGGTRRAVESAEAEGAERRAVALAHDRYRSGLVDFLDVLETERALYAVQTELARGERAVGQDLVRLYKALGGGWGHEAARAQVTQPSWLISSEE